MEKENKPYTLMYLAARLFAGGYLLYTAWNLRDGIAESAFLIVAMVAFGIIGLWLVIQAGLKILKGDYEGGSPFFLIKPKEDPEPEDETE